MLISMPSSEVVALGGAEQRRWEKISVHITTGHRLRRNLGGTAAPLGVSATDLPLNAEALIDPSRFSVSEAVGGAHRPGPGQDAQGLRKNASPAGRKTPRSPKILSSTRAASDHLDRLWVIRLYCRELGVGDGSWRTAKAHDGHSPIRASERRAGR